MRSMGSDTDYEISAKYFLVYYFIKHIKQMQEQF